MGKICKFVVDSMGVCVRVCVCELEKMVGWRRCGGFDFYAYIYIINVCVCETSLVGGKFVCLFVCLYVNTSIL